MGPASTTSLLHAGDAGRPHHAPALEVSAARKLVANPAVASVALTMSRRGQPQLVQDAPGHNLTSLAYPEGTSVTRSFDELDRLSSVLVGGAPVTSYVWMGRDRLKSWTSGVTENYTGGN